MRPIRGRADRRTASIHPPKDSPGATSEEFAADVGDDEAVGHPPVCAPEAVPVPAPWEAATSGK
jgi:hypothetical protein